MGFRPCWHGVQGDELTSSHLRLDRSSKMLYSAVVSMHDDVVLCIYMQIDLCRFDESLTEISGTTGPAYNIDNLVKSLKFVTNKRTYGPYGRDEGTPFRVKVMNNGHVAGFFGRSGDCLDAIGLYVNPN